ncbi:hypothetical protein [Streptomyces sp. NPDC090053]|uniref:hypothetical protein n=1 Tax=Streptomyces sp. NPDC090053 TaxID=3365932 RepID=UPI003817F0B9
MHRTRITTMALLGAAVSAVSGCVSVPAGPTPQPSPPAARHTRQDVTPQIVQGPAVETLESVPPAPSPSHRSGPPAKRYAPAPAGRAPAPLPPPRIRHTAGPAPKSPPKRAAPAPGHAVDVCALGRSYGGWPSDSPQARICRQTYGH